MDGWIDGWMDGQTYLHIDYSADQRVVQYSPDRRVGKGEGYIGKLL